MKLGTWQTPIYHALRNGERVMNPMTALKGRARAESNNYLRSLENIFLLLEQENPSLQVWRETDKVGRVSYILAPVSYYDEIIRNLVYMENRGKRDIYAALTRM